MVGSEWPTRHSPLITRHFSVVSDGPGGAEGVGNGSQAVVAVVVQLRHELFGQRLFPAEMRGATSNVEQQAFGFGSFLHRHYRAESMTPQCHLPQCFSI